jgi:hypothetical protein
MTYPVVDLPSLDVSTIVPEKEDLFIPYLTSLYENIASTVNNKDNLYYDFSITSFSANIPNLPNYGAYIICVSGVDSTLPTITASLCKADASASGSVAVLGSQVGTGAWSGNSLTISSSSTNFQISHNRSGITGNFNIKFIGTQI